MTVTATNGVEERIENPAIPISEANVLRYLGGIPNDSGVVITEESALSYTAVLAAVRILAESIAVLPMKVYKTEGEGQTEQRDHPSWFLVHDEPNPQMTPSVFKETMQGHLASWGNAYARIIRDDQGTVRELWPLHPRDVTVRRTRGQLSYTVTEEGVQSDPMPADDVLHIPGLSFNGLVGFSPIGAARQSIGVGVAAEQFNANFFNNGAWLGGILEHPAQLSDQAYSRLLASFNERHGGLANTHKPAILEEGMSYNQLKIPTEDALFIGARKFQVTEIARLYRIPPHMLADLERATFSNIEHLGLEFVKFTLLVWITKWEQEVTRKVFTVDERRAGLHAEFTVNAFLRGDMAGRFDAYQKGREGGWLSINDIRGFESMNPIDDGDDYLQPMNFQAVGAVTDDQADDDTSGDDRSSLRERVIKSFCRVFVVEAKRVMCREVDRVKRLRKQGNDGAVHDYYASSRTREAAGANYFEPCFGMAETLWAMRGGVGCPDALAGGVDDLVTTFVDWHATRCCAEVTSATDPQSVFDEWNVSRPSIVCDELCERVRTLVDSLNPGDFIHEA